MTRLAVQFLDQAFHRVVFDAMPLPMFVVDPDVTILEYNAAAARFLGKRRSQVLGRRCGDVLECINAALNPNGCGRGLKCDRCAVRNSVKTAVEGAAVAQRPARVDWRSTGRKGKAHLQVTAQPFRYEGHSFVLLILDGLKRSGLKAPSRAGCS